jgi:oligopeptide/dipeptide ABC transporter ATP-binding protein
VMYAGRIVEQAPTPELFSRVRMPYTKVLLDAIPRLERSSHSLFPVIGGQPPDMVSLPPGCPFAPRCPSAQERCVQENPPLAGRDPGHRWACWYPCPDGSPN